MLMAERAFDHLARDRQLFEKIVLKNGITVFHYDEPRSPLAYCQILIPVGSKHNLKPHLPGTAHLLEHLGMCRSRAYPRRLQWMRACANTAMEFNAFTSESFTRFHCYFPVRHWPLVQRGLVNAVFHPLFHTRDLKREFPIIKSEREQDRQFYPGDSHFSKLVIDRVFDDGYLSLRQIFGEDNDLRQITPDHLAEFSKLYRQRKVTVIIVGPIHAPMLDDLAAIDVQKAPPHVPDPEPRIIRTSLVELHSAEIETPTMNLYALVPIQSVDAYLERRIMVNYLGSVHGPLWAWVRDEKGWVYASDSSAEPLTARHLRIDIAVPFRSIRHIRQFHVHWKEELQERLQHRRRVRAFLSRFAEERLYRFTTLKEIGEEADAQLQIFGTIYPERLILDVIERLMQQPQRMAELFSETFTTEQTAQVLALPRKMRRPRT